MLFSTHHTFIFLTFTSQLISPATSQLINNLTATTSSFNILITDTTGQDISPNITILHHHSPLPPHPSPSPSNEKRTVTRSHAINTCPFSKIYRNSHCRRDINLRAYKIFCKEASPPQYVSFFNGNCAPNQLCLGAFGGGSIPWTNRGRAFCLSEEDFVKLAAEKLNPNSASVGASEVGLPSTGVGLRCLRLKLFLRLQTVSALSRPRA